MQQLPHNRSSPRPAFRPRMPAVGLFLAVGLVLFLLGRDAPGVGSLVLKPGDPGLRGFLASNLFHEDGIHATCTLLMICLAGGLLETAWGTPRFVAFYLFTAWGSTFVTLVLALVMGVEEPSCGASGVALACLVAAGTLYPEVRLLRWFPPAKHVAWVLAFLGGTGLVLLPAWRDTARYFLFPQASGVFFALVFVSMDPWFAGVLERRRVRREQNRELRASEMRHRVDDLLEKISAHGIDSLTQGERTFLRNASKHFRSGK